MKDIQFINLLHEDQFNVIDADESDYLFVRTSQVMNAGDGLFTAIQIYKDELFATYQGEILKFEEASARAARKEDQYFIHLLNGDILDSKYSSCFARYANDANGSATSAFKNNTAIRLNEEGKVCLVATRNIKAGEEIFVDYGKSYWKKH